jgi:hypothetical protein
MPAGTHEQDHPFRLRIRQRCHDLETTYDREAAELICGAGILADEKTVLAMERILGGQLLSDALKLIIAALDAKTEDKRTPILRRLDEAVVDGALEAVDTAYLLGVAVGRRLGPKPLVKVRR